MTYEAIVAARRTDLERSAALEARRAQSRQRRRATRRPAAVALGMGLIALGLRLVDAGTRRRRGRCPALTAGGGLPMDPFGAGLPAETRLLRGT